MTLFGNTDFTKVIELIPVISRALTQYDWYLDKMKKTKHFCCSKSPSLWYFCDHSSRILKQQHLSFVVFEDVIAWYS